MSGVLNLDVTGCCFALGCFLVLDHFSYVRSLGGLRIQGLGFRRGWRESCNLIYYIIIGGA